MMKTHTTFTSMIAGLALLPGLAAAAASAEEATKLKTTLTPVGAERAGNKDGSIPAWEGGLAQAPAGYKNGATRTDPFAAEKPLYSIDAKTMAQHDARLSDGVKALMKKYPGFRIDVYPTHRTAAAPQWVYDNTAKNATRAKTIEGGHGVEGAYGGIPFPIPKDGLEAIWNHLLRYRGDSYAMTWSQAAVTRDGNYTLVRLEYEYDFHYGNLSKPDAEREENKVFNFLQTVTAPARLAGQILLVHETLDQTKEPRSAWTYNPGQRRVRLAPQVAYDNPGTAADGLRTSDDFGMFNGATDRYNWKLVGKKEMYVPYNSYRMSNPQLKYADLLKPGHLNQDLARYELHRVWVVEATLKPGTSHIYSKRVFYIDEDSWAIVATDKYDGRGELWRYAEQHNENWYNVPMFFGTIEVHNDLQSGRYIAMGLRSEEKLIYEPLKRTPGDYTPANLRGVGTR